MIHSYKKYLSKFFHFLFLLIITIIFPLNSQASDYNLNHNPKSYVLTKFKSHDIVFLGTRHKQPPILEFISEIITVLHDSGVTHIGLEIESDQQGKIEHFIKTGTGLKDIQLHPQIDCPEYRNLFIVIGSLEPNKRPSPVALDLPKSKYSENISRDEWMVELIAEIFDTKPNAKMLVVVGNNHVLKKLDWQDSVVNNHGPIREYLFNMPIRLTQVDTLTGDSGQCWVSTVC